MMYRTLKRNKKLRDKEPLPTAMLRFRKRLYITAREMCFKLKKRHRLGAWNHHIHHQPDGIEYNHWLFQILPYH
jgi:hypothetical protein